MYTIFLPGIGASHRDFHEYKAVFENLIIIRYKGCISIEDHFQRIDETVIQLEQQDTSYIIIGHSLGANLAYHYVNSRSLDNIKAMTLVGGGPRFVPLKTWNTIFGLPRWGIGLVLFFIVLGAPFLFLVYGWHGMYQRVNVIDLFKREGIANIKGVYQETLMPLLADPKPFEPDLPVQLVILPNDLLLPDYAVQETAKLVSGLDIKAIPRKLIHFSHDLDVLVAGYIHSWLVSQEIISSSPLPYDTRYAMAFPESVEVDVEDDVIGRVPVITAVLLFVISAMVQTFPDYYIATVVRELVSLVGMFLGIPSVDWIWGMGVILAALSAARIYRWLLVPQLSVDGTLEVQNAPPISIIVPTRNEERNIASCLKHLFSLRYPNLEIIVSDGQSEDNTLDEVARANRDFNPLAIPLTVIREDHLPDGWVGKSWGCWQGVRHAGGEIFLFTDADTVHSANSLRQTAWQLETHNLAGLSVIGKFETVSFWERSILPFFKSLMLVIFGGRFNQHVGRVLAIGQYILVKSEIYYRIGGHQAIKSEVAEDIHLAELIATQGDFMTYHSNRVYQVRMYQSLAEIREGLERNAFEAVGQRLSLAILASMGLLLWRIVPLLLYPLSLYLSSNDTLHLLLLGYFVFGLAMFFEESLINGDGWYRGWYLVIGLFALVLFLLNSSASHIGDKPRVWKGRFYHNR